jgi:hypothetical protein
VGYNVFMMRARKWKATPSKTGNEPVDKYSVPVRMKW